MRITIFAKQPDHCFQVKELEAEGFNAFGSKFKKQKDRG